jgi:hypothetical protein
LGLAFLACSGVVAAQIPAQFRIVRHVLVVDVPRREAVFNLWFSETPDLATFDQFGRQSHAFQYFLELPDHRNFGRHLRGLPRLEYPLITALSGEVATGDRVVARVITPGTTDSWGPLAATADIQQLRSRVSFRLPLSIFDSGTTRPYEGNEQFAVHYFLQALRFGRTTYYLARGAATVGTVDAKLRVHRREVRTSNGSTRVLLIAQVLAHPSTEEEPFIFLPEFADVASVRFGPNRARPIGNELRDVNGDRSNDLVLTFNATDVGLSCIDTYVTITGEIPDPGNFVPEGTVFIGRAARTPQPC